MLPSVDERSLVALAVRLGERLAPGYAIDAKSSSVREREEEETSIDTYSITTERIHGGEHGIRYLEVQDCSSDAAGPSVSAIERTVSVPGWPPETALTICVHVRQLPFRNAGLTVDAELASPNPERLVQAFAVLDEVFERGQVAE